MFNRLFISALVFLMANSLLTGGHFLLAQSKTADEKPAAAVVKQDEDTKKSTPNKVAEDKGKASQDKQTSQETEQPAADAKDDEKPGNEKPDKAEDPQKKPATAAEIEYQRRMDSLKKSVEKEERPDRPSFKAAKLKRNNGAVTFDDIKFEMEKGQRFNRNMLTDEVNGLVGKKISIKGYIRPNNKNRGLKKFVFVRDDKECCFGPGAALYDCVLVTLAEGKESDFTVRPITVEGEFYLKEFKGPDRRIWAVYRMNNCRVVK